MTVTALPAEIRKFLRLAHAGELHLKFKNFNAPVQLVYRIGHQSIFASSASSAPAGMRAFFGIEEYVWI